MHVDERLSAAGAVRTRVQKKTPKLDGSLFWLLDLHFFYKILNLFWDQKCFTKPSFYKSTIACSKRSFCSLTFSLLSRKAFCSSTFLKSSKLSQCERAVSKACTLRMSALTLACNAAICSSLSVVSMSSSRRNATWLPKSLRRHSFIVNECQLKKGGICSFGDGFSTTVLIASLNMAVDLSTASRMDCT